MTAARFNEGKPRFSTVHPIIMEVIGHRPLLVRAFASVGTYGARKYDDVVGTRLNYMLGGTLGIEYMDSALRHAFYIKCGEDIDKESGCRHLDHIVWNIATLLAFLTHGKCEPIPVPKHISCDKIEITGDIFTQLHSVSFRNEIFEDLNYMLCNGIIYDTILLEENT